MQKGLIGKKIGMTQIFDDNGNVIPVTVVEAGPCTVVQKKTVENDGYAAVQMGYGDMKAHKVNKPMQGHFAKGDVAPKKVLREFRLENTDAYNVGDLVKVDVFAAGDKVDVCGAIGVARTISAKNTTTPFKTPINTGSFLAYSCARVCPSSATRAAICSFVSNIF